MYIYLHPVCRSPCNLPCFPSWIHVGSRMGSAHYGQIHTSNRNLEVYCTPRMFPRCRNPVSTNGQFRYKYKAGLSCPHAELVSVYVVLAYVLTLALQSKLHVRSSRIAAIIYHCRKRGSQSISWSLSSRHCNQVTDSSALGYTIATFLPSLRYP